ncbi:hypothetical protein QVD17_16229 [Tagetes erecta]|uniref:Uncharacterized protein n=1 Tax=Tagetes erecta TaxID=13708 RepID=A0AAD8KWE4_TARER|nr:hypothetical protein QVD17_16229 [Tagetes erecta]
MENHNIEVIQVTDFPFSFLSPPFFDMISNMKILKWLSVASPFSNELLKTVTRETETETERETPTFREREVRSSFFKRLHCCFSCRRRSKSEDEHERDQDQEQEQEQDSERQNSDQEFSQLMKRFILSNKGPSFLSIELRYINWEGYPNSPFPDNFQLMKLVILRFTCGLQKELWKDYKFLPRLKVLELIKMENLLSTPDFDGLPCLEKLTIRTCKKLKSIHPSLGRHTCLQDMYVSFCYEVIMCPTVFELGKLKTLEIMQCHRFEFPEIKSNMKSLVKLSLNQMGIDVLLSSVGEKRFPNLTSLELSYCYLNNKEANYHALQNLEEFKLYEFKQLKMLRGRDQCRNECLSWLSLVLSQSSSSLRKLDLSSCCLRDGEIPPHIGKLYNLRELSLGGNDFSRLDFSLLQLTKLKDLSLRNCKQLIELPELPSSLAKLDVAFCSSLKTIGDCYKNCEWLCQVEIRGMNLFIIYQGKTIEIILCFSNLKGLRLQGRSTLLLLEEQDTN